MGLILGSKIMRVSCIFICDVSSQHRDPYRTRTMDIYGFNAPHLPISLLTAIATSEPRLWMYGSDVTHGILRFLHLIGAAGFVGTVIPLNLGQLGWLKLGEARPLRLVLEVSFWLAVVTGVVLFVMDPIATGLHTMFLPKLVLVVLGGLRGLVPSGGAG